MRFLLFQTTLEQVEESYHDSINAGYPLGLAYIHSYATWRGHVGRSFDFTNLPLAECRTSVLEKIAEVQPDLIGYQVLSSNRTSTFDVIDLVHRMHPHTPIVIGGIHASERYREILKPDSPFAVIVGEAERGFSKMLDNLRDHVPLYEDVSGAAYIDRTGELVRVPASQMVDDLDAFPFPAHDQFLTARSTYASLITSRGCPFACSFCSVSRRPMRFRSIGNVVDEIEFLKSTYPQLEAIRIWDDQFFFDNERVISICDEIVKRNIKMKFICLARLKPCSRELVLALERAGFVHVLFGLETGSRTVSLKSNKKIKLEWALETASLFADSRINISMFLIVGLEGETAETVLETSRFVQQIQTQKYFPCWWNVGIATVYPGTDLFSVAKQKAMIGDDYWETTAQVPLFTAENTLPRLQEWLRVIATHTDPLLILEAKAALDAQRHLIPSIILWVLRNFGLTGDPYVNDSLLSPLLDVMVEAVGSPSAVQLRLDRSLAGGGPAVDFFVLERSPGTESTYVARRSEAVGRQLVAHWLLVACQQSGPFLAKLSKSVETILERRLNVRDNAIIEGVLEDALC